jgi:phosphoribosylamine-glycine ligase
LATSKALRILILGSGGREHAFAWKLAQSKRCAQLFIGPGNAGTSAHGQNVPLNPLDFPAVEKFVLENQIDLVVVVTISMTEPFAFIGIAKPYCGIVVAPHNSAKDSRNPRN